MPATWGSINAGGPAAAAAYPAAHDYKAGDDSAQGTMSGYSGEEAPSRSGGSRRRGKKETIVAKPPPWAGAGWDPRTAIGTNSGGIGVFLSNASRTRCSANSVLGAAVASSVVGNGGKVVYVDEISGIGGANAGEPAAVLSPSASLPKLAVAKAVIDGAIVSSGAILDSKEHLLPVVEREV